MAKITAKTKYKGQPVGEALVGKHIIWIIWGESPDLQDTLKENIDEEIAEPYIFENRGELDAFIRGVNEMEGNQGYFSANTEQAVINTALEEA
jgi:hypothetical protein